MADYERRPYPGYRQMNERPNYGERNRTFRMDDVVHEPAPPPFNPNGTKCLIFNDHYYDYSVIVRLGGTGPHGLVDEKTLHPNWRHFVDQNFVMTEKDRQQDVVIVMQYEGKFVVLTGMEKVLASPDKPVKARILSKMSAKKAYRGDVESK